MKEAENELVLNLIQQVDDLVEMKLAYPAEGDFSMAKQMNKECEKLKEQIEVLKAKKS